MTSYSRITGCPFSNEASIGRATIPRFAGHRSSRAISFFCGFCGSLVFVTGYGTRRISLQVSLEAATFAVESVYEQFGRRLPLIISGTITEDRDQLELLKKIADSDNAAALAAATPRELLPLTGPGWRGTTRIAKGNAKLWRQILEENRLPALQALQNFAKVLEHWQHALESGDGERLEQLLEAGKATRDALGS